MRTILQALEQFARRNAKNDPTPSQSVGDDSLASAKSDSAPTWDSKVSVSPDAEDTPDSKNFDVLEEDGTGTEPVTQYQAGYTKKFLSEMAREWIRKTKLRQEIVKADEEARSKCKYPSQPLISTI